MLAILRIRFYVEKIKVQYDTQSQLVDLPVASHDLRAGDVVTERDIQTRKFPRAILISASSVPHLLSTFDGDAALLVKAAKDLTTLGATAEAGRAKRGAEGFYRNDTAGEILQALERVNAPEPVKPSAPSSSLAPGVADSATIDRARADSCLADARARLSRITSGQKKAEDVIPDVKKLLDEAVDAYTLVGRTEDADRVREASSKLTVGEPVDPALALLKSPKESTGAPWSRDRYPLESRALGVDLLLLLGLHSFDRHGPLAREGSRHGS